MQNDPYNPVAADNVVLTRQEFESLRAQAAAPHVSDGTTPQPKKYTIWQWLMLAASACIVLPLVTGGVLSFLVPIGMILLAISSLGSVYISLRYGLKGVSLAMAIVKIIVALVSLAALGFLILFIFVIYLLSTNHAHTG